ncbi:MAG: uracil-DNA glycosylase [Acholeplasmatales bacterium]|jgi:uracil-DNA glycosylase|nr:uracil-DNA glycosylase [Acholeplasmatales bacterium]
MKKKILNVCFYVVVGILSLYIISFFVPKLTINLFTFRPYVVKSDSMEPKINVNDVVFIGKADIKKLKKEDIITFQVYLATGEQIVVTHYIYEIYELDGKTYIRTHSKNETSVDTWYNKDGNPEDVNIDSLIGKLLFTIPFSNPVIIPLILIILLIVLSIPSIVKSINQSFFKILEVERKKDYFKKIDERLEEYAKDDNANLCPKKENIFRCLELTPITKVKVVVIGLEPYDNLSSDGLAYSTTSKILPDVLLNIKKEIESDQKIILSESGDLSHLATQGVLLLNYSLTVQKDNPGSDLEIGWFNLVEVLIKEIDKSSRPIVFILWGNISKLIRPMLKNSKHMIITGGDPNNPTTTSFFGSKPFSKANKYLVYKKSKPIDWKF